MNAKQLTGVVSIFFLLIILGGGIYQKIEGWRYLDAVYFSAMTVTTIGYGDFVPKTDAGKIFTIFFAFSGIAMAFYILTSVGKYLFHIHLKHHVKQHITKRKRH